MKLPADFGPRFRLAAAVLVTAAAAIACGAGENDTAVAHSHPHSEQHLAASGADVIPHIDPVTDSGTRLRLLASTSILEDVVSNVAGELADISVLIPRGQNPHSFEPTPGSLRLLEEADIVFMNGVGLEEDLLEDIDDHATGYVVPLSAGIEASRPGDPHVWTDPNNAVIWVENAVEVLSEADPENAATYRDLGTRYIQELSQLDLEIRQWLADIPETRRKLIVDHDGLGYFAEEYGFRTVGAVIPSFSDRAEPSARDLAQLVETIRREQIPAIFVGQTASRSVQDLADAIASEVGQSVGVLTTLTGSLNPAGERGDTYLDFLRFNAEQIRRGLGD